LSGAAGIGKGIKLRAENLLFFFTNLV